jgi:MFS family permease
MGISPTAAASIVSVIGGASIISRILVAWASDRFGVKATLIFSLILLPIALVLLQFVTTLPLLYLFAAVFGFSYGGIMALMSLVTARLFGLRSVGVLMGMVTFLYTIGGAIGPLVTGYIYDISGSYSTAFWLTASIGLIACILAISIKVPASEH